MSAKKETSLAEIRRIVGLDGLALIYIGNRTYVPVFKTDVAEWEEEVRGVRPSATRIVIRTSDGTSKARIDVADIVSVF